MRGLQRWGRGPPPLWRVQSVREGGSPTGVGAKSTGVRGPLRGESVLGRVGEGFTEEVTFDLGLGEGTGKNHSGGNAHPPGQTGFLGFCFP